MGFSSILAMTSKTAARRVSKATLIPLFLIVLGIFVWGVRYKLSLYDAPGSPSRSIAQAKLLSPNERPESLRTTAQLRPQMVRSWPLLSLTFLIAALWLGIRPNQLACATASAPEDARHGCESVSNFFFFRPPPAFNLA